MYLADTLSRAFLKDTTRSQAEAEIESVHMMDYVSVPISDMTHSLIQAATAEDSTMQTVKEYIAKGWPDQRSDVKLEARPFFHVHDELAYDNDNGLIFKGQRIVIPRSQRQRIREKLHHSHQGIQSTLRRARDSVYWPNMTTDITDYVSKCEICNSYQTQQQKEPLLNHEVPQRPWQKIGVDLLTVEDKDYLCTVDYYSDYFEVDHLPYKKDCKAITKRLKHHFSSHGIPDTVFTDNGPPFNSKDFKNFATEYEFNHKTSSPEYAQSNGKAESAVKIAKKILLRTKKSNGDLDLALLEWRNTPTEGLGSSPAQRLFGRRTKSLLPTSHKLLKPQIQTNVKRMKAQKQETQKKQYDKHAKPISPLKDGETVRMKPTHNSRNKQWTKAKVKEKVDIRSYNVITEDGREYRRNRKHLKSTQEAFTPRNDSLNTNVTGQSSDQQATKTSTNDTQRNANRSDHNRNITQPMNAHSERTDELRQQSTPTVDTTQTGQTTVVRRSSRKRQEPKYMQDYVKR
jgi:hypothetical protein